MTLPSAQDTSFEVGGQKSGGLQPSRMDVCLCFLSVRERSEVSGVTRSVVLKKDMKCFLGKKNQQRSHLFRFFYNGQGKETVCFL